MSDNFFAPLAKTDPYMKIGFQGFAGTGKTYTSAQVAIGIHQRTGSKKPIIMYDTENASRFLEPLFLKAKIELLVKHSRTLSDLIESMKRCRNGLSDILIIDSISHVWESFLAAFRQQKNLKAGEAFQFQHWGQIKPQWKREFSEPFVNDPYSILMCGRAGYEYENEKNEQTGKREIYKSGVKMKVEGETAYEPDILVFMERFEEILAKDKRVYRTATIVKDRSGTIDGMVFENPEYIHFAPAVEYLLSGTKKVEISPMLDDRDLIEKDEQTINYGKEKDKTWEEIEGFLTLLAPSSGAEDKKTRALILKRAFNIMSEKAIRDLTLMELKEGLRKVEEIVNAGLAHKDKCEIFYKAMLQHQTEKDIKERLKNKFAKANIEYLTIEELEELEAELFPPDIQEQKDPEIKKPVEPEDDIELTDNELGTLFDQTIAN